MPARREAAALIGPAFYGEALGENLSVGRRARRGRAPDRDPRGGAGRRSARRFGGSARRLARASRGRIRRAASRDAAHRDLRRPGRGARRLVSHRQATLFADALSLVEQARINPTRRILSLLTPSSRAGLVAGPFAALVGASELVLHGPFVASSVLAHLDAAPGTHLVAPIAIGVQLAAEVFTAELSSLILVSRFDAAEAFFLPRAASDGVHRGRSLRFRRGQRAGPAPARRRGAPAEPRRRPQPYRRFGAPGSTAPAPSIASTWVTVPDGAPASSSPTRPTRPGRCGRGC